VKVLQDGLAALVIELPVHDVKKKAEMLKKLHKNKILYKIEGRYLVIEGFKLEVVEESNVQEELFIKYDIDIGRNKIVKWVYVKMEDPNIYYRIKSIHCSSKIAYINALKRRRIPSSCIKMASEVLREEEITI